MALVVGNGAFTSTASGTSLTLAYPNNVTAGSTLVVGFTSPDGGVITINSVTDNNNNVYIPVVSPLDFQNRSKYLSMWAAQGSLATPNAKPTVSIAISVLGAIEMGICEITGAATTYAFDQATFCIASAVPANTDPVTGNVTVGSLVTPTTYQASEAVIGWGITENGTIAVGTGMTSQASSTNKMLASKIVSSTGQQSALFKSNAAGDNMGILVATFRAPGAITGFYHVQGDTSPDLTPASTTTTWAMPKNPTPGNLVAVVIQWYGGGVPTTTTLVSVKDSNNNFYALTQASPLSRVSFIAYLLSAPANATRTLTFTFADTATDVDIWGDEFTYPAGTATFDKDLFQSVPDVGATTILNQVTFTPTNAGELIYASAVAAIAQPVSGQPLQGWTGAASVSSNTQNNGIFAPNDGAWVEYVLSCPGGVNTVYFINKSTHAAYPCIVSAFKFTSSSGGGGGAGTNNDMLNITRWCTRLWG